MIKALITGADGFIGSHLSELLLEKGYKVKALAQYNSFNYCGWLNDIPHINNLEITSLHAYRTSVTENTDSLGKVTVINNSLTYTLPKESITTFTGYFGEPVSVDRGTPAVSSSKLVIKVFPNPFSHRTTIKYKLPISGNVVLKVYDVFGNEVAVLVNEFQDAGEHSAVFNAENYPQGMYYYTIQIGERVESGKLVLVR